MKFTDSGDHAAISDDSAIELIANLLGTSVDQVVNALCYRVVATHHEVMHKQHTSELAAYGKDALAKVCYRMIAMELQHNTSLAIA